VRAKKYDVQPTALHSEAIDGGLATWWQLKLGNAWTVPVAELTPKNAEGTTLVVADEGRTGVPKEIRKLLKARRRVLAVDPFYFGESRIAKREWLFAMTVAAVGDRPLGLQASQLTAVARHFVQDRNDPPIELVAHGPRSSLFALVAAALEPEAIGDVTLHRSLGSLREIIEQNMAVRQAPELFCFGLFEQFDIPQLGALVAPRRIRFVDPSGNPEQSLAELRKYYRLLGLAHDPLSN